MGELTDYLHHLRSEKGLKAKIRNKLLGSMYDALDKAEKERADQQEQIDRCFGLISEIERHIQAFAKRFENDAQLQTAMKSDIENAQDNLRGSNNTIEKLVSDTELLKLRVEELKRKCGSVQATAVQSASTEMVAPQKTMPAEESSDYEEIDYFDFENHFRGSIDSIKKAQEMYLEYFKDKKNVLDIGCGRGEFLALMKDNGINAKGVDIYAPYADYCNMKGLDAVQGDGVAYLSEQSDVDGIFVGQVVEHLKTSEIIRLCNTAYEKLSDGGCIVIETPNPTSLAIYTNAFYIDPSHVKPVHPLTMKYLLEKAGFKSVEIIFTENSRPQMEIPPVKSAGGADNEEFNNAMQKVSQMLFGSQDYAVIAVK